MDDIRNLEMRVQRESLNYLKTFAASNGPARSLFREEHGGVSDHFAAGSSRQRVTDCDLLRNFKVGEICPQVPEQVLHRDLLSGSENDGSGNDLASFCVRNREHDGFVNLRMPVQHVFDFGGVDVEAAGDNHIVLPAQMIIVAVAVTLADVARIEP